MGLNWQQINKKAPWGVRAMPRGGVMDGYFYVISGRKGMVKIYSDTWRSKDGINWECMSKQAGWGKRCYPDVDCVDGDLVLTGGQSLKTFFNDVWRSSDQGRTWEQVCADAPWAARAGHHSHVINGDIYLFCGGKNSTDRVFYPELWVSKDKGESWELRAELPEDMGRAGMQVVHIDGTIYFMGGDHDNPVWLPNWPGRRNDVWKSDDLGESWEKLGEAPWAARTGQQAVSHNGVVYLIGGHKQGDSKYIQDLGYDLWTWEPKACDEGMEGWQLADEDVWNMASTGQGKSDFMLEVHDNKLWTFGGDRERFSPWPQDNDVWAAELT